MAASDNIEPPTKKRSKKHERSVDEGQAVQAEVPASGIDKEQDEEHAELIKEQQMYRDIVNKIGAAEQQKSVSAKQASPDVKKAKTDRSEVNETSKRIDSRRSHSVSARLLDEFKRISKPKSTGDEETHADTAFRFIDTDRSAALDSEGINDLTGPTSMDVSESFAEVDESNRKHESESNRLPRSRIADTEAPAKAALTLVCTFAHVPVSESERSFAMDLRFVTEFEREWKARRALVGRLVKHRHRLAVSRARQRQTPGQLQSQQTQARAQQPKAT